MTQVIHSIKDFQNLKLSSKSLGFVPTMGALHDGHLSLIKKSLHENQTTVLSIFVNPTQFNNSNDLINYPKTWEEDLNKLQSLKVDYVLSPTKEDIYPLNYSYKVCENELSQILCGARRPGHFDGVLSVVLKLLNIVQPHRAYFGEKDYQQFLLIKNMVTSFFLKTEIISCPVIREPSGLAMSSRNKRLSAAQLSQASLVYEQLKSDKSLKQIQETLEKAGFKIDYLEEHYGRRFIAVFLGDVRLIDNVEL